MKNLVDGDVLTMEELNRMGKEELLALAKANGIKTFTVVPEKLRTKLFEVWNTRQHKGDAFRNL